MEEGKLTQKKIEARVGYFQNKWFCELLILHIPTTTHLYIIQIVYPQFISVSQCVTIMLSI